jgi:hypothetical protein
VTLEQALSILGPSLTTMGAGLLAYDVLRTPVRLTRQLQSASRLEAAERGKLEKVKKLGDDDSSFATGEHEAGLAQIDASFVAVVGRVKTAYADATEREGERAFRLAIWGLLLVAGGGIAETVAAILGASRS